MNELELYHHGILGQRWGIRRFQNKDGSLTPAGKKKLAKLQRPDGSFTEEGYKKISKYYNVNSDSYTKKGANLNWKESELLSEMLWKYKNWKTSKLIEESKILKDMYKTNEQHKKYLETQIDDDDNINEKRINMIMIKISEISGTIMQNWE